MEEREKKPDFRVRVNTDDPVSFLIQQVYELRIEIGVLTYMVMDGLAADGTDPEQMRTRYKDVRERLSLDLAFDWQDKETQTSEE